MRYCKGRWHYKDRVYTTLHDALAAVWPREDGGD